ncbi:heat shock protein 90-6, mitochondrial, partial [Tanacetum coccineum]
MAASDACPLVSPRDSKDAGTDGNLIAQFGVGFYSAFLVADKWSSQQKVPDKKYVWEGEANTSSYIVQDV